MIAIKLMGGLGNQMFQYAFGRKISLDKNTKLALDLTFFNNQAEVDTPRHYELDCYKINPKLITKQIPDSKPLLYPLIKRNYFLHRYLEKAFPFNEEALGQPDETLFQGYWQTEKYFLNIRDVLLNDFSLAYPLSDENRAIEDSIKMQTSVSLHVRRGDYVSNANANEFHGLKGIDYYIQAVKEIKEKIGTSFKLYIFSDDMTWCKENLSTIYEDIVYVDGDRPGYVDMWLMRQCNHNIIANSSFSWWAAWLNDNNSKVVVAPLTWFDNQSVDTSDIIPSAWIRI